MNFKTFLKILYLILYIIYCGWYLVTAVSGQNTGHDMAVLLTLAVMTAGALTVIEIKY